MQGLHGVLIKYTGIYLWKQNSEYIWCSTRLLYKLLSSYRDRSIQNTVKRLRRSVLEKKNQIKNGTRNQGTSINSSSKTQEKHAAQGNILEFFLLLLKLYF